MCLFHAINFFYSPSFVRRPSSAPPPYPQYSAPAPPVAIYSAMPASYVTQTYVAHPQMAIVVPAYRPIWRNMTPTVITANLRNFLIISGLCSLLSGISAVGLEIGIIINSYSTYYRGFWMGGCIIGCSISMLFAASQASYNLLRLTQSFTVVLIFCVLGSILSVLNLSQSTQCQSIYYIYSCDREIATNLKIAILAISLLATVHTIVNMIIISNLHKRTVLSSVSGVRN
jgi:hypothetical protein